MDEQTAERVAQAIGRGPDCTKTAWLALEHLCEVAQEQILREQDFVSTDSEAKARQARKLELLTESYVVLVAWTEFAHCSHLFSEHGYQSLFLKGSPMDFLADIPDVVRRNYGLA